MSELLTDKIVRDLPLPPAGRSNQITYDSDDEGLSVRGFGVRVTAAGAKSYVLNYRTKGGKERRITIGAVSDWSVAEARDEARLLRRAIAKGEDPQGKRHEQRGAPTVDELADRFMVEHRPKRKLAKSEASRREDESLLRQWIRPELGTTKVADLLHEDITRLHRKVTANGTPYRANRVYALINTMLADAVKWKIRVDNPAKGVELNPEHSRERYLNPKELTALTAALAEHPSRDGANAIRLLLLTGSRRSEVLTAQWSEFDLAAGVWTKPRTSTKQGKEHRIPLSAPAKQLLVDMHSEAMAGDQTAARLEREAEREKHPKRAQIKRNAAARARLRKVSPFLFPSRIDGQPLLNIRRVWEDVVNKAGLVGVRLHDLRHSFASYLASSGMSLPLIGAMLGHSQAQTTMRYAHLLDQPLRLAADRVGEIVTAAERGESAVIVPLLPKQRRKRGPRVGSTA